MMKFGIVAVALAAIAAFGALFLMDRDTETPMAFYERYRTAVLEGRTFDEDAAFYSARKRAEVEAALAASGGNEDEVKAIYLDFTAQSEACGTRRLVSEDVTDTRARLVYDIVDCPDYAHAKSAQDIIDLVEEDGWKIDGNETSLQN